MFTQNPVTTFLDFFNSLDFLAFFSIFSILPTMKNIKSLPIKLLFGLVFLFTNPTLLMAQHTENPCKCGSGCGCKTSHHTDHSATCKCGPDCKCGKSDSKMEMHHHAEMAEDSHPYIKMMDDMMQKMHGVKRSKTVEAEFILQMIAHHQGAVDMANYQIKNGTSTEMIQLAKSILSQQQYEIELMQKMLEQYPKSTTNSSEKYLKDMDKTMETMMTTMPATNTKFASIDQAFAQIMLPHHQAAIDMCRVVLAYTKQKEMKTLAQSLIAEQIIEIEQMQEFIKLKK